MDFRHELTIEELNNYGIDTSQVAVCKKLRRLAKLDRIILDETEHRSGINKHLFRYLEYCGKDVLEYVKEYLSNLQPYMLERKKDQEPKDSFICVIDNMYRISLYIKVDTKQFEEVVVSFHENHKRGIAKDNSLLIWNKNEYIPVFADSLTSKVENQNQYSIKVMMQRGIMVLPINLSGYKCNDFFIVYKPDFEREMLQYCNQYIRQLYTSDLQIPGLDEIEVFATLQQISFTSYGRDTFSSLSLLIDSVHIQHDKISRAAADFALVTFSRNLKLTTEQKAELIDLLREKYTIQCNKDMDTLLTRIEDNLELAVIPDKSKEFFCDTKVEEINYHEEPDN